MPELPEVETTVRGLRPLLEGERIERLLLNRADLRRPFPVDLVQRMTGATVTTLSRRAKYGLIATTRGDSMIFHLGMSGRWRTDVSEAQSHDHLIIETGSGKRIALNDPRRFGSVDLVDGDPEKSFAPFRALGPEPLSDAFNAATLAAAFQGRIAPVKTLLLDQRIVAGLGNIYVCEALNMAGIAPTRAAGQIATRRLDLLTDTIKAVLTRAIEVGGSSLRDFVHPDGELGYFSHEWRVYGREGERCRSCGKPIARLVQGGRSTFHCPKCQK
jgi:formamidopyrimidine-DNA glycosylase